VIVIIRALVELNPVGLTQDSRFDG
jgi:hypothetical protein